MFIKDLLPAKARPVIALPGDRTVAAAIEVMTAEKTGALIVTADDRPTGIFTRGDLMRAWIDSSGVPFSAIPLQAVMTDRLITAAPGDLVADTITVMLQARIGHLPVSETGRITAMLTMRDMVAGHIESLLGELDHLNDYIARLHDSIQD
jgi:CBS domain-containing protein